MQPERFDEREAAREQHDGRRDRLYLHVVVQSVVSAKDHDVQPFCMRQRDRRGDLLPCACAGYRLTGGMFVSRAGERVGIPE